MSKTTASQPAPSPNQQASITPPSADASKSQSTIFIGMALDMSWRLALVVLVPIIGGFEIDKKLHTTPVLIIIGFILAMVGTALVLWQTLKEANSLPVPKLSESEKRAVRKRYEEEDD